MGPPPAQRPEPGGALSALAFGLGAPVYSFLTAHDTWRASRRALGALVPGPRVLDVGIGPGTSPGNGVPGAARDDGALRVGLDRSAEMLRRAAGRARTDGTPLQLVRADGMALPFAEASLDGVTAHSLLYLLPDPGAALAEIRRVLRPGGRAAFLEPRAGRPDLRRALAGGARCAASMILWRGMSRLHARFAEPELAALLARAGLREIRAWPVLHGYGVMAVGARGA